MLLLVSLVVGYQALVRWAGAGKQAWLIWLPALPNIAAYGFLCWFFGRTLVPGRQALITRLARTVHGELPPEIARYTRRVTWYWCAILAAMGACSVVLAAWSATAWVWFLALNAPLIAAAFLAEFVYRHLRFPRFSHASLLATIRAFRAAARAGYAHGD